MTGKIIWFRIGLVALMALGGPTLASAKEKKAAKEKAVVESSDELEEGSKASVDDGMDQSRFGEGTDDTYTDDSASLDDLGGSKFLDEKDDDDQGMDDQDNP